MGPVLIEVGPIEPLKNIGPIEPVLRAFLLKKYMDLTSNNPILLDRHRQVINKIYSKSLSFSLLYFESVEF